MSISRLVTIAVAKAPHARTDCGIARKPYAELYFILAMQTVLAPRYTAVIMGLPSLAGIVPCKRALCVRVNRDKRSK